MTRQKGVVFTTVSLSLVAGAFTLFNVLPTQQLFAAAGTKSAAELEKEKAMQNPYPNDLGPEQIDDVVKAYPKEYQEGYKLVKTKCAQCHSSARPLNSRFVEPNVPKPQKEAEVAKWKSAHPEMFKDATVWQIEHNVWERYVKRMMAKPGCNIDKAAGKKIWEFLVYDSTARKVGDKAKDWELHRKKLVNDFKAQHPKRYEELAKDKDL